MRRTAMPRRKTGLRRTELSRGTKRLERETPLARVTPLERQKAKAATKKPKRRREGDMPKGKAQQIVRTRSGGWCELRIPGHCLGAGAQFAHRKPDGQGGEYVPSNGLRLCGLGNVNGCHGYQENNRTEAYDKGWLVHRDDDHRMRPVWMWYRGVWGEWLLDDEGGALPAVGAPEVAA